MTATDCPATVIAAVLAAVPALSSATTVNVWLPVPAAGVAVNQPTLTVAVHAHELVVETATVALASEPVAASASEVGVTT